MYDCQTDSYTEFSHSAFDTVRSYNALSGNLTAAPLLPNNTPQLNDLAAFAGELGYQTERNAGQLVIHDIAFCDALSVNARFGRELIISCDLRRDPPALFG
jgi:hypothetical protein